MVPPFVSVIIPVFRNPAGLSACLAALRAQTHPRDRFEIIVVNNDPSDTSVEETARAAGAAAIGESAPGSYAARNAGVALAAGEILAFTDSDCLPRPDWLEKGVAALVSHPEAGFAAGRIALTFQNEARPALAEDYDRRFLGFPQDVYVRRDHFGATANVFARCAVFDAVGVFNAGLKSYGDYEWGRRAHAAGFAPIYADDAVVEHPARPSFAALASKNRRLLGGEFDLRGTGTFRELLTGYRTEYRRLRKLIRETRSSGEAPAGMYALISALQAVRAFERTRLFLGGTSGRI